jgi:hypothetical protein
MNARQLRALAVALGLLVVLAALKRVVPRREVFREETQSLEIHVTPDAVDRVSLSRGGLETSVGFQRIDGVWRLPALWNARADAERIRRFLDSLAQLTGEPRGGSEHLFDDFGITDAQALHVTLSAGSQEALHLLIGTKPAGWQQFFARRSQAPTVFLCRSTLLSELGVYGDLSSAQLSADAWLDLKLFSSSPDAIERAELREGTAEWRELGGQLPFDRDDGELTRYLQDLLNVQASGVADPDGTGYGFEQPAWELRLLPKGGGSPIVLTVGGVKAGSTDDRHLKVSDIPQVFHAARDALERIKVEESRFIRQDPLEIEDGARQALRVETPDTSVSLALGDARWPGLDEYLQGLQAFRVSQVNGLAARAAAATMMPYRIEVSGAQPQDTAGVACEKPEDESTDQILCRNEQRNLPFLINRATFQSLFTRLERLDRPQPKPEEQPTSPASPAADSHLPPAPDRVAGRVAVAPAHPLLGGRPANRVAKTDPRTAQ